MHPLTAKDLVHHRKLFSETDVDIAGVFKILSDVNRYRIFLLLTKSSRVSIGSIAKILDISVPLASQHLRMLVHAKLVQKERDGKKVFPRLERRNPLVQIVILAIQRRGKAP